MILFCVISAAGVRNISSFRVIARLRHHRIYFLRLQAAYHIDFLQVAQPLLFISALQIIFDDACHFLFLVLLFSSIFDSSL